MTAPTDPPLSDPSGLPEDDPIPLLTEVIAIPDAAPAEQPAPLPGTDRAVLARQVHDDMLERLLGRTDALFEESLRTTLDAIVARAAAQLQAELQPALTQLARELIARALAEELAALQAQPARRADQDEAPI